MAVPSYEDMMLPMLKLIARGHQTISSCIPGLIDAFEISAEDQDIKLPSGKQTRLNNRAHWARQYLSQAGLVEPIRRGHYRLTKRGDDVLASGPARIDNAFLQQFEEFRDFKSRSSKADPGSAQQKLISAEETPEATLQSAISEIDDALVTEILSAIQGMNPT